jgi:hypothetical protein
VREPPTLIRGGRHSLDRVPMVGLSVGEPRIQFEPGRDMSGEDLLER